jgi:hypothetical protein
VDALFFVVNLHDQVLARTRVFTAMVRCAFGAFIGAALVVEESAMQRTLGEAEIVANIIVNTLIDFFQFNGRLADFTATTIGAAISNDGSVRGGDQLAHAEQTKSGEGQGRGQALCDHER